MLVSIPVIRALRNRYPRAQIHMLFSRANYGVRDESAPDVDHAWRYDKTPASALRLILGRTGRALRHRGELDGQPVGELAAAGALERAPYRLGILL